MLKNMSYKSFLVKVELTIQKISCPGVWLCSNGKVSLQLCMLDSNIQTESYKPSFPMIFNEKFVFYKTFLREKRLNELQRSLTREWFCAELIQWKNCDEGVVLASFQSTLDDLLYPSSLANTKIEGADIDLLLEPTKLFPGTIAPKLELKTKTTIEESFCKLNQRGSDKVSTGTRRRIACSNQSPSKPLHPRSVCHTIAYSRAQQRCPNPKKDKRPIFQYRRPEDDLILRLNPEKVVKDDIIRNRNDSIEYVKCDNGGKNKSSLKEINSCYCGGAVELPHQESTNSSFVKIRRGSRQKSSERVREVCGCSCGTQHHPYLCPICAKYQCTFAITSKPTEFLREPTTRTPSMKLCSYCRDNYDIVSAQCPCENPDSDGTREKKVCFCLPKERTCSMAQRLHGRLMNTMQNGASSIENCIKNCEVCE